MNKKEFVDQVADKTGLSKTQADKAVNAVFESLIEALKKKDSIAFLGFGSFSVKRQAARQGRNPQTGDAITITARNAPAFKASQALKDALNKKKS